MNATCPHCNTVFRIDPDKVPDEGARARCSICRGIFRVERNEPAPAGAKRAETSPPEPTTAASAPHPEDPEEPAAETVVTAANPPPVPQTSSPAELAAAREPAPPSPPATAPAPSALEQSGSFPFGSADPQAKARRLARALVSDMVMYHPERRERGLKEGTLKQDFKEEIRKSWEEYVEQVGTETARGTPFFRDALNDVLARGQQVF